MNTNMNHPLIIRQVTCEDVKQFEDMYLQRVMYNDEKGTHQWCQSDVTWEELSKLYCLSNCYVGEALGTMVACMMIVEEDQLYWPLAPKGEALYLHKLCVHPHHCGLGYSDKMISYFKDKGRDEGYARVRLDVREHKAKLRVMYERNDFRYLRTINVHPTFQTALYEYSSI